MRLTGLLVAPFVLAGCAGGGHAAAPVHRVYEARVTVDDLQSVVWLDASGGRFRVTTPVGHRRIVTVSDGRTAVMRAPGLTTRMTGSPGFLMMIGGPAVRALRDRLLGRGVPSGATITSLHRVRAPSVRRFAVPDLAAPDQVMHEVRVGVAPHTGPQAYWLGGGFRGKAASYAWVSTGKGTSSYTVAYPGVVVEVDSSRFEIPTCGTTPVVLVDGTHARLAVAPDDLGPCDGSTGGMDFYGAGSDTVASGGGLAVVKTADGAILIFGPAVSADTAAAIAHALRPV